MHALACEYALKRTEEALGDAIQAALPLCALGSAYPAWRAVSLMPAQAMRRY